MTRSVAVTGIAELTTHDPALGTLHDAAVVTEGGLVAWVGPARRAPVSDRVVDLGGRAVVPGFVDSHTHLVFAGERSIEFGRRRRGERYEDIGVVTLPEYRGAGLCVACAGALCRDIEGRGRRPTWTTSPDNTASLRVAEKLGFVLHRRDRLLIIGVKIPRPARRAIV